jgi:hypothetical protein
MQPVKAIPDKLYFKIGEVIGMAGFRREKHERLWT